jgi:flagellar FliJ protein
MKKYQFRLEAVLKVRKLKEENCRMELGHLLTHLNQIEDQIRQQDVDVDNYYKIQDSSLKGEGIKGSHLQAFPMLLAAKKKKLTELLDYKNQQEKLIEEKKSELSILRGELKVIENLKEKDYNEYRKAVNKEIDQKVEEQTLIWYRNRENKA